MTTKNVGKNRRRQTAFGAWSTAVALFFCQIIRGRAQDGHVDYKYEDYQEDHGRVKVGTESILAQQDLVSWLSISGELVFDTIAGSTPTGMAPASPKGQVPLAYLTDFRYSETISPTFRFGTQTITPSYTYSREHDYDSDGLSLNDSIDFNEKNTTLNLGVSQNLDRVLPYPGEEYVNALNQGNPLKRPLTKNSTDGLIGINQLLGPNTVLTANAEVGYEEGFLADPYRRIQFDSFNTLTQFGEKRPRERLDGIAYSAVDHCFSPVSGTLEASYRYYEDTYGILAHTVGVTWLQKLGSHVVLSPYFRFYTQTAASFYYEEVPAIDSNPANSHAGKFPIPTYYSADYRLSELNSYTYGLKLTVKILNHAYVDADFKRYQMVGNDPATSQSAYPSANVINIGLRILW